MLNQENSLIKPVISSINLDIREKGLLAVIGPIGSGKTTFLNSILNETIKLNGE